MASLELELQTMAARAGKKLLRDRSKTEDEGHRGVGNQVSQRIPSRGVCQLIRTYRVTSIDWQSLDVTTLCACGCSLIAAMNGQ